MNWHRFWLVVDGLLRFGIYFICGYLLFQGYEKIPVVDQPLAQFIGVIGALVLYAILDRDREMR